MTTKTIRINSNSKAWRWHLTLPYRIVVETTKRAGGATYVATHPELPECPPAYGGTRDEAVRNAHDVRGVHLKLLLEEGKTPALPDVCKPKVRKSRKRKETTK